MTAAGKLKLQEGKSVELLHVCHLLQDLVLLGLKLQLLDLEFRETGPFFLQTRARTKKSLRRRDVFPMDMFPTDKTP